MESSSDKNHHASARPTWDEFWFALALMYSTRGTCDRLRTACLLVDSHNRLVSAGYNGSLPGQPHCDDVGHLMIDGHCLRTLHAEENALLHTSREDLGGCTAYILDSPCVACTKKLLAKGIKAILFTRDFSNVENADFVNQLVGSQGVEFRKIDISFEELIAKMMGVTRGKGGRLEGSGPQKREEGPSVPAQAEALTLRVERISPYAKLPTRSYKDDAGLDLYANDDLEIVPYSQHVVGTGLRVAIPSGYAGFVWDKSGLAANYSLKTAGGVIDAGYRGELKVILHNFGAYPYVVRRGEKIAQLVIKQIPSINVIEGPVEGATERQNGGFGSTGLI